ncbi:MAG: hypothetical protein HN837_07445 [Chloroflexi bacterium]|nr:hypothetical protein [Chloroflexota bacterium]
MLKGDSFSWLYLGQNVQQKAAISAKLGSSNYHHIGNQLQEVARNEKTTFVDMIADLGLHLSNKLHWWASNISYKSPLSSDFFLHWCYAAVFKRLFAAESKQTEGPFLVFVENIWLYKYLCQCYGAEQTRFCFLSRKSLITEAVSLMANGLISRLFTFLRILNQKRRSYIEPKTKGHTHVYVEPTANSFRKENEYMDRNFDELKKLAVDMNTDITYVVPPSIASGIRKKILNARKERFILLDQYTGIMDLIRGMLTFPAMIQLRAAAKRVPALGVLLQYEALQDIGPLFKHILAFLSAKKWFNKVNQPITLIYVFENQPLEKMLCMAVEGNPNIKLAGYQCSGVSNLLLNFLPGKAESGNMPVPHSIIASGKYTQQLFQDAGYGDAQIINGGSFRYEYLHNDEQDVVKNQKKNDIRTIMVAFTYSPDLTLEMLMALFDAFADTDGKSCHFILKFHPNTPPKSLGGELPPWPPHFEVSGQSFAAALERADMVLYSSSTAGLETYLAGVPVIRYDSEHNLSLDPMDALDESTVPSCSANDMKSVILSLLNNKVSSVRKRDKINLINYFFSPVNVSVWQEIVAQSFIK